MAAAPQRRHAVDCKHFRRKGIMRNAHAVFRFALASLLVLLSVDAILYMGRFIKVNCSGWSEDIKASQLPKEVVSCVELYDDPPESVGVYVLHRDIDGDGIEELIVDSGTNGRGAANWHYTIWKRQLSGIYRNIGFFCADGYLFVPGWRIRGLPGILCNHGKVEWVPWRDGQYSCRGPI